MATLNAGVSQIGAPVGGGSQIGERIGQGHSAEAMDAARSARESADTLRNTFGGGANGSAVGMSQPTQGSAQAGESFLDYFKNGGVLGHIGGENGQPNAYGKWSGGIADATGNLLSAIF